MKLFLLGMLVPVVGLAILGLALWFRYLKDTGGFG